MRRAQSVHRSSEPVRTAAASQHAWAARHLADHILDFHSSLHLSDALQRICNAFTEWLADGCGIYLVQDGTDELSPVAYRYVDEPEVEHRRAYRRTHPLHLGQGITGRVLETQEPFVAYAATDDERLSLAGRLEFNLGSLVILPMVVRGSSVGLLTLHRVNRGQATRRFDHRDVEFASLLATQAALAIENLRLHEATVEQARHLMTLLNFSNALAETLDLVQVLEITVDTFWTAFGFESVALYQFFPETNEIVGVAGRGLLDADGWRERRPVIPQTFIFEALRTRQTHFHSDVRSLTLEIFPVPMAEKLDIRAHFVAPLVTNDRVLGIICAHSRAASWTMSPADIVLGAALASQTALAMRRAIVLGDQEQLAAAREQLLFAVSHELRGPVTSVISSIDTISAELGRRSKSDLRRLISLARRSGEQLHDFIEELLDARTIRAGRLSISLCPTDLWHVIDEGVALVESQVQSRGQLIVRKGPQGPLMMIGDRRRLRQVVGNLVENASRYGPEDAEITVQIGQSGESYRVEVMDGGAGVSENECLEVFSPFVRGRAGLTKGTGIGLGLTIARAIVEAHGGIIGLDSLLPTGTLAWFEIPMRQPRSMVDDKRADR